MADNFGGVCGIVTLPNGNVLAKSGFSPESAKSNQMNLVIMIHRCLQSIAKNNVLK